MDVLWVLLVVATLALGRLFAFEIDRRERERAPGELATGLRTVASIVHGTIGLIFAAVLLIAADGAVQRAWVIFGFAVAAGIYLLTVARR